MVSTQQTLQASVGRRHDVASIHTISRGTANGRMDFTCKFRNVQSKIGIRGCFAAHRKTEVAGAGFSGTIRAGRVESRAETMDSAFMQEAIGQAVENVRAGRGGPFAAVVVKQGRVIAAGLNCVTSTNDP